MAFEPTPIVEDAALTVRFDGFSIREDGGANPVLVEFFEDTAGGALLLGVNLAADEERTVFFPEEVIGPVGTGVVHTQTTGTGTLDGVVFSRIVRAG